MIVFAAIMPHPPESIPKVGTLVEMAKIKKTLAAFKELRKGLEEAAPDTIIIISPHAHMEPYRFVINSASTLVGNFAQFGIEETYKFKNDLAIADKIAYACSADKLRAILKHDFLDYGALVPLYHLTKNMKSKTKPMVVHLSFSLVSYKRHYRYGQLIKQIVGNHEFIGSNEFISGNETKRVAIIASGDLSHRLTPEAPAGYSPKGEIFDHEIIRHLGEKNVLSLLNMPKETVDEAGECGIRSILILLGALHGEEYSFNLLSYESPFGIGYMVARLV